MNSSTVLWEADTTKAIFSFVKYQVKAHRSMAKPVCKLLDTKYALA